MSDKPELKIEGLRKRIGDFELRAELRVRAGERAVLMGGSGSGKTTLLRLIAGLETPDRGSIRLGGKELVSVPTQKREIGFVFQDHALFPALNVLENAAFGLRMRGFSPEEREAKTKPWLERIGLGHRLKASVNTLSGGERQRVAFVRALVFEPRILLLDEPFSALDTELRGSLRRELLSLHDQWPVPLLFVTHDPADVAALATIRYRIQGNGAVREVSAE